MIRLVEGRLKQRGETIIPQGRLPFQYEIEGGSSGLTALAGLPVYLDLMAVSGLRKSFDRHVMARNGGQGWTDGQMGKSFVMLNIAGGDCVDDLKTLEGDDASVECFSGRN